MSGFGVDNFEGELALSWRPCAQANPAADPPLGAIAAVYDELGRAVAVGELADRLGVPGGAKLVEDVAAFVSTSPKVLGALGVETGGVASAVGSRLVGAALKAWEVVESAAARSWRALQAAPTKLLVLGAGVVLASQYLSQQETAELSEISTRAALLQDVVMALPPEERARALAEADLSGGRRWSFWTWAGIGLAALAGVWAWSKVRR